MSKTNTPIIPEGAAPQSFFTNPNVEAKYASTFGVDKKINIPGVYSGMLSKIDEDVAELLVKMEDNQLSVK